MARISFLFGRSTHPRHARRRQPQCRLVVESLETRCLLSAAALTGGWAHPLYNATPLGHGGGPSGYTPAQVKHAYGFDQITNNGSGQTIAIVDAFHNPNIQSDLAYFDNQFGLDDPPSFKVNMPQGQPQINAGWALEISLDIEWAHALAPQANIILEEAANNSYSNLLGAVDDAVSNGAVVVSMSWGGSEFSGETGSDSHFNASGVTFVASSGDSPGTEYPAVAPGVVAVGGTTLNSARSGTYQGESVWGSSGGGYSSQEGIPGYQNTYGSTNQSGNTVLSTQDKSNARSSPDVAYDADPSTGVAVYDTVRYQGRAGWFQVGGTSAGAPQWAALVALADQSRSAKLSSADTLQALYALAANSSTYASDFHDVGAVAGYDVQTGLGTPQANNLIPALSSTTLAPAARSTATVKAPSAKSNSGHGGTPAQPTPNAEVVLFLASQAQHVQPLVLVTPTTTPTVTPTNTAVTVPLVVGVTATPVFVGGASMQQDSGGGNNAMISDTGDTDSDKDSKPALTPGDQAAPQGGPAALQAAPAQEGEQMGWREARAVYFAGEERVEVSPVQAAAPVTATEERERRVQSAAALPALLLALGAYWSGRADEEDQEHQRRPVLS
jgi:subtilase family serine protease